MAEKMSDERVDELVRLLGVDCAWAADELGDETQRSRASEAALTAERDAALKRAEEAEALGASIHAEKTKLEAQFREFIDRNGDDLASLRAQVARLTEQPAAEAKSDDDDAAGVEALETEKRLRAQLEQVRGALDAYVSDDECIYGMDGECPPDQQKCRFCEGATLLAPSPGTLTQEQIDAVQPPATVEEAEAIIRNAGMDPTAFVERAKAHAAKIRAALSPSPAEGTGTARDARERPGFPALTPEQQARNLEHNLAAPSSGVAPRSEGRVVLAGRLPDDPDERVDLPPDWEPTVDLDFSEDDGTGLLHDRVGPASGRLLHASPVVPRKDGER